MQHPDEGMIHTWLDGELSQEEATALEGHAAACEQCKVAIAEARGFIAASSRIVSSLDAVPGGVIPVAKPVKRMWYASPQFRAAAAVLVVAGASLLVMRTGGQKATMAVSTRAEASEASTAQRVMSASGPSSASSPALVPPPAVGGQSSGVSEAAKPAAPVVAQDSRARREIAPKTVASNTLAAKEADFSGKGVKGGSASGVSGAGVPDTGAVVSEPAMKAADAVSPRSAFALAQSELKIMRVDSSALMKKTTYQLLSGRQVVLTEQGPELTLSEVMVTGAPTENRETKHRRATASANLPVAPAPAAPAPAAPAPAAPAPAVQSEIVVHTISWMDSSTRRRYSLSGPVPVEELEAIKARLLQAKR